MTEKAQDFLAGIETNGVEVGQVYERRNLPQASRFTLESLRDHAEVTEIVPFHLDQGKVVAHARLTYLNGLRQGDGVQIITRVLTSDWRLVTDE